MNFWNDKKYSLQATPEFHYFKLDCSKARTRRIMRDTFWVGVYPGMTEAMVAYMVKAIKAVSSR